MARLLKLATRTRPRWCYGAFGSRELSSISTSELIDRCDLHILQRGPYMPVYEFVTQAWKPHGGFLDKQVAIVDGSTGIQRSFHDHYVTSHGVAAALKLDMDVGVDSCVALYCPNHVDYLPIALAVSLCGASMTPVNPMFTAGELEVILQRSRSSVLIVHHSLLETALKAAKNSPGIKHVVVVTDDGEVIPEGTIDLRSLRHHNGTWQKTPELIHRHLDTRAFLLPYSSGTTGLPKGVCLTHSNIVANLLQFDEVEGLYFAPSQKLISPLPFFHIYAFVVSMLTCAWKGQTLITMSGRFDLETFCKLVEEHKPYRAHLVPPIILALGKSPVVDKYEVSSLRMITSAAAPMSAETEMAAKKRLGGCEIKQIWGMSELSPMGTYTSDYNIRSGSIGQLISSTVGKVIDENGQSLGPNETGELCIKGPQVMLGYLDDPDKTAECLHKGWLRTGDMVYYDEDGFLYVTDRIKELIKVRGFPVAPAELEALLNTHECIADAAVIQVPDDKSGELPRAYVVLKDTEEARKTTEKDIYEWVKERVAAYKRLDGGVVFVDAIPKSASGKILRRLLRDQLKAESAA